MLESPLSTRFPNGTSGERAAEIDCGLGGREPVRDGSQIVVTRFSERRTAGMKAIKQRQKLHSDQPRLGD
jgi:hypothetical protein